MGCPLLSLLWTCWLDTCVFYGRRHQHGRRNLISDLFHLKKLTKHSSFSESHLKYSSRSLTKMLLIKPSFFCGCIWFVPVHLEVQYTESTKFVCLMVQCQGKGGEVMMWSYLRYRLFGYVFPFLPCHSLTFNSYSSMLYTIAASRHSRHLYRQFKTTWSCCWTCTSTLMKSRSPLSGDGKI